MLALRTGEDVECTEGLDLFIVSIKDQCDVQRALISEEQSHVRVCLPILQIRKIESPKEHLASSYLAKLVVGF